MSVEIGGDRRHNEPDAGTPVGIGGVGRSANPSKVSNGARVSLFQDLVGRIVTVFQQCRDLVTVGNITLSNGTETTLLAAGGADIFHDAVLISGANDSTVAVTVAFRDAIAGTIRISLQIPANDTRQIQFQVPYPQTTANNVWTADMPDITGTNVRIFIQAVKNV